MQTQMLIGGRLTGGEGPPETVLDAASGAALATVAAASTEQVDAAVAAAETAFDGWAATAPRDRAALLLQVADALERNADAYASLESRNTGKPLKAMLNDEMPAIADVFRYFAGACRIPQGLAAGEYQPGCTSMIRRDPVGVVGSIAPWNYPLMMAAWKIAPAIAAGNTLVLKPSEFVSQPFPQIRRQVIPERDLVTLPVLLVGRVEDRVWNPLVEVQLGDGQGGQLPLAEPG